MNWLARIDSITNEHIDAVRLAEDSVEQVRSDADQATQQIAERVAAMGFGPETPEERAAREAREERDRLLNEFRVRQQEAASARPREGYVQPSDWTDVDEARSQGYGRDSWLV